jgi:uncharacterized membrane protein YbhN (UPF0104 family)
MIVSVISSVFELIAVTMLAYSIGTVINPVYYFIFVPIIWVILAIPISIGGLGVRETVFAFFFTQVGMTTTDAFALSLLYYSLSVIAGILGASLQTLTYLATSISPRHQSDETDNSDANLDTGPALP